MLSTPIMEANIGTRRIIPRVQNHINDLDSMLKLTH